ncbi:hypothetical protein O6H91_06G120200 [Diphasiastrum complanatum]|uniref:Uncharacterized protein n=1 Tax=Diphasiastrum complanatum TaxID=34168 RepID=A0ACC2DIL7_DIPCM|nr:hypothetical protein O6H91_06G120200 [Diphasiastrum complanatum]
MTSESVLVRDSVLEESVDRDNIITDSVLEWLAPRISFSNSFAQLDTEEPIKREESITTSSDFEFSMSASSDDSVREKFMLTADELFNDGKLLPLPIPSQALTSAEEAFSAEDQKATSLTIAAHLDKETSDESSASFPHLPSSDSSCSSLSQLFPPRPPKGSSSWNTLKNLFNLKKAEGMPPKGSLNRSECSSKSSKLFRRGSPEGKAANTQNFCRGSSLMTSLVDRARTKPSQAVASLLLMPTQAMCCSVPSENEDEIATADEAIDHENRQGMSLRSVKTVYGQGTTAKRISDSNNNVRGGFSSGKSASLPCSRTNSPERGFGKDLQKGLESIPIDKSTVSNSKRSARIKLERCTSTPRSPGTLHNQEKTYKQWEYSKFYQEKKGVYNWKSYSDKVITYPSGVRVAPVLNVPACLGPSLRKGNPKGNFTSFKELFSRNKDGSVFKDPLTASHVAWH